MEIPVQPRNGTSGLRFASIKESIRNRLPKWPRHIWVFIAVLIIAAVTTTTYLYLASAKPKLLQKILNKQPSPTGQQDIQAPAKPTPHPLATGVQTYTISGSAKEAPKMTHVTIDPIDPAKGTNQTWKIEVIDAGNGPVKEVTVTLFTDNGKKQHSLKLVEGTNTKGVWQGSWKIEDSYDYTYVAVLRAKNEAGKIHKVDLVLR